MPENYLLHFAVASYKLAPAGDYIVKPMLEEEILNKINEFLKLEPK